MDFREYSIEELVSKITSKEISAKELTQEALNNLDRLDDTLNTFCAVNDEDALKQASDIDARLAKGEEVGKLAGIPIGVKDLEDAKGFVTTYGSALHVDDEPAEEGKYSVKTYRLTNSSMPSIEVCIENLSKYTKHAYMCIDPLSSNGNVHFRPYTFRTKIYMDAKLIEIYDLSDESVSKKLESGISKNLLKKLLKDLEKLF